MHTTAGTTLTCLKKTEMQSSTTFKTRQQIVRKPCFDVNLKKFTNVYIAAAYLITFHLSFPFTRCTATARQHCISIPFLFVFFFYTVGVETNNNILYTHARFNDTPGESYRRMSVLTHEYKNNNNLLYRYKILYLHCVVVGQTFKCGGSVITFFDYLLG